jgi:hypothetical protein
MKTILLCVRIEIRCDNFEGLICVVAQCDTHIATYQKQREEFEYFDYLDRMITNGTRHVCDSHSKSGIQKEEKSFHKETGLEFKQETSEMLHLERSFVWC